VAMIGPMPGTLARRWLTGLLLCQAMSCFSSAATAPSNCSICAASTASTWRAKSGSRPSPSSRTMAISLPTLRNPCGATLRLRRRARLPRLSSAGAYSMGHVGSLPHPILGRGEKRASAVKRRPSQTAKVSLLQSWMALSLDGDYGTAYPRVRDSAARIHSIPARAASSSHRPM
jgi:hypothetical protein